MHISEIEQFDLFAIPHQPRDCPNPLCCHLTMFRHKIDLFVSTQHLILCIWYYATTRIYRELPWHSFLFGRKVQYEKHCGIDGWDMSHVEQKQEIPCLSLPVLCCSR